MPGALSALTNRAFPLQVQHGLSREDKEELQWLQSVVFAGDVGGQGRMRAELRLETDKAML